MSRRNRSVIAALVLTTASAAAAWMIKRRHDAHRAYAGLYFEDGSMVSLPESSPQASLLIDLGHEAVDIVRGA